MSARVTDSEVKQIIETSIDVGPFIQAANLVVTDQLASANLGDDFLKEIERWLSAHLVAIRERQAKSEKTDDASVTYFGKDGLGLDSTPYGQQVKVLDVSGTLALLGKKKVEFTAIDLDL